VLRDIEREAFVERVKAIDRLFKAGDVEGTLRLLPTLMAMGPERPILSQKKSHYVGSLALRCLRKGDSKSAIRFLDFADANIRDDHLIPLLRDERARFRKEALRATGPGVATS